VNTVDTIVQRSVAKAEDRVVTLRFGRVTAVADVSVTVDLAGTSVSDVSVLASYSPKVDDWAWLLSQGSQLVAIGCSKGVVTDGGDRA
jgi:hypothetical protein